MSARYVSVDRDTPMLLPCDMREWVREDDMVHFVIEALKGVDLGGIPTNERGSGSEQYPPLMMLGLLVYCYAGGIFSSRKIERMTYQDVSARYLCADTHPDHDTIASFRKRHDELFRRCFQSVLRLARELKLVNLGTIFIDGTKILADASKRRTFDAQQLEAQWELADRAVIERVLEQAEQAEREEDDRGYRLSGELADPALRKARLEAARAQLAQRAAMKTRSCKPTINLTDPDSRLQSTSQGGYVQGYNAQLAVEASGIIVGQSVAQSTNDRRELVATAATIESQPGEITEVVVDQGYDTQAQIDELEQRLEVSVICEPQRSKAAPWGRCTKARAERVAKRTRRARLSHTSYWRETLHRRQTTIEPLIGGIKRNLGFRRFHLRGLRNVQTEWSLVTTAYNCRTIMTRLLWRAKNLSI